MPADGSEEIEGDVKGPVQFHIASQHRHRLVGLEAWGVVAEIWQRVDPEHPSPVNDIVRLDDDFGR